MLLNDRLILRQAKALADRVAAEAGTDPDRVIDRAFRLTLSRPPTAEELAEMRSFVEKHGSVADLCHVLLNLNEFLYVD
jgi:hypothetical protein